MNLLLVFEQGDPVLIGVFAALILMSIVTWSILLHRGVRLWQIIRGSRRFLGDFWQCRDWDDAYELAQARPLPVAAVAQAGIDGWRQYRGEAHGTLGAACGLDEFLVRVIRNALTQAVARLETGLAVLASVAATAPFVGLFGTVWGIYHALIGIAAEGNASLDTVAGPLGEALVATAAGLAAALPALLAYNLLARGKRVLQVQMDGFAHDLHARLLATPVPVAAEETVVPAQRARA